MADSEPLSRAPIVLDRYELIEKLGDGASAAVWRAHDRRRRHDVALKLLHPHLVADQAARMRLQREAQSARRLRHAGIVRLLDAHLDAAEPALAFEHVAGETLAQRMSRTGPLQPAAAAAIAGAVARALAHAHAHGLVHRDVKPSNVLLGADGSVRLLDFGISSPAGESALTEAGTAVGTLPYMPPEQLAGRPADPASDVYALGAVMYEMLAGQPPYPARNALALAESQRTPPALLDGRARPLAGVALAALWYEATTRPSAAELAAMIEGTADAAGAPTETLGAAPVAVPVALRSPGSERAPRRLALVRTGGAAAAAAVVVLALAVALPRIELAPAESGSTPAPPADAVQSPAPTTVPATPLPAAERTEQPAVRPASTELQPDRVSDGPPDDSRKDQRGDKDKKKDDKPKDDEPKNKEKKDKKKDDSKKGKGKGKGKGRD